MSYRKSKLIAFADGKAVEDGVTFPGTENILNVCSFQLEICTVVSFQHLLTGMLPFVTVVGNTIENDTFPYSLSKQP